MVPVAGGAGKTAAQGDAPRPGLVGRRVELLQEGLSLR